MNRKERRARKLTGDTSQMWHSTGYAEYKRPKDPPPHIPVPGIDIPPEIPEFTKMVNSNTWHDKEDFQKFVDVIKELAVDYWATRYKDAPLVVPIGTPDPDAGKLKRWSWAYNSDCKYVDLRIDMRDGGFVMTNRKGERINLEQLLWQWRSESEREKEKTQTDNPVL
jgi:hypothetical protein